MKITRVGLDIAKRVFQVHGVDEPASPQGVQEAATGEGAEFFAQLPPCLVGMEACGSCALLGSRADQARAHA